jgi:putative membrane protein
MHYVGASYWGMHFFWWMFWIAAMVLMFSPMTPVSRGRRRETALEVLQRRYAAGELTTEAYEERKTKLERDTKAVK